ncbi:MAG TPA: hypothetical protein VN277_07775 [Acidiferrobacterales bacterium]|nr:hypothetical protein [Acidiferrobacterales bacterium]
MGDNPLGFVSVKISPARFDIMLGIASTNLILGRYLRGSANAAFLDMMRVIVGRGLDSLLSDYREDPPRMNADNHRVLGKALWNSLLDFDARAGSLRRLQCCCCRN